MKYDEKQGFIGNLLNSHRPFFDTCVIIMIILSVLYHNEYGWIPFIIFVLLHLITTYLRMNYFYKEK